MIQDNIANALLNETSGRIRFSANAPRMENTQKQYYADNSKAFYERNLKWSANLYEAQVQGLDYQDFYTFQTKRIRIADVIDPSTGNNLGADWQRVIVEDGEVNFLPRGAKVIFNGNVWLIVNPKNMGQVYGVSVMRRCNATWRHLDFWGNVLKEPFCYGQGGNDMATSNKINHWNVNTILAQDYQNCCMQLNPETAELAINRRMILGGQAYAARGLQNFVQEYSEDEESTHIQFFDLELAETIESDDLERGVADGKALNIQITLSGDTVLQAGDTAEITPCVYRNKRAVFADDSREVDYLWASDNDAVFSVQNGRITATGEGTATLTCTLAQNPEITATREITVEAQAETTGLVWILEPPKEIHRFSARSMEARYLENGKPADTPIFWELDGAQSVCYEAKPEGGKLTIACYLQSEIPLKVTARCGAHELSAEIRLVGR